MILSVLIATLPERAHLLQRCLSALGTNPMAEILIDDRPRGITTGEKRNALMDRANGMHLCFVDDDDIPLPGYLDQLIHAIQQYNPDCVTMEGFMTTNAKNRIHWIIKLGEKYEARVDADGITRYYRWPNHLVPIRTEIARSVRFEHITMGEDYRWSKMIHDRGLIKTSHHIPLQLYHYDFITSK